MEKMYEHYYNLPRNVKLETPLREVRAVREMIDSKIKDMTPAEMTEYFRNSAKTLYAEIGAIAPSPR